jgi:hypothetical protein
MKVLGAVTITHNIEQVARQLGQLSDKNIRFATARALTMTARDAQTEIRKQLPQRFTIRRSWVSQGVRINKATPQSLTATVFHMDEYLIRQEAGGVKTGKAGGGNFTSDAIANSVKGRRVKDSAVNRVAIPTQNVLRTKSDIIKKSDLPSGHGNKAFVIGKGSKQVLVRRFSKGKRAGLKVLYVLKPRAYVPARFEFRETGAKVALEKFPQNFQIAVSDALKMSIP